ncbi:MAG: polysaccharide biosynthesis/export family protein [Pseudomonadota bacterium]
MFPRLLTVSVVCVATLAGCKHRDSFVEFRGPDARAVPPTLADAPAPVHTASASPLERLETAIFGPRAVPNATPGPVEEIADPDDGIVYVDPAAPSYKTAPAPAADVSPHGHEYAATAPRRSLGDRILRRGEIIPSAEAVEPIGDYTLDTGDRVRVIVFGQPEITRVYNVDGRGRISVPLLGSVLARGRTTRSLRHAIKHGLERKVLKDAKVAVEIAVYRPFFIHGEVRTPGQYPYVYGLSVEAAIATAGGFSPRARKSGIRVARTVDGVRHVLPIAPGAYIRPGDVITVDERFF